MNNIDQASKILNQGGIVIFPTDTVWGIGCRLDFPESIARLFKIRKRPLTQAVPILVGSINQAKEYYQDLTNEVENLLNKYWPGGLTVVYQGNINKIPALARANKNTVGLRMPNHQDLLYLINSLGVPLLGPSANFHTEKTPVKFSDLNQRLIKLVDYVLPGESMENKASTVIDVTQKPWKILRQGLITLPLSSRATPLNGEVEGSILFIDTTDNKKIVVSLANKKRVTLSAKIGILKAQVVLPLIEKLLAKNQLRLTDITEIKVNTGPGSYTGIRVGLSVANALAYALGIKVNGKKLEFEAKY